MTADALPARSDARSIRSHALSAVPSLIEGSGEDAARRFIEFFTVTIRNPNTRSAYGRAVRDFCDWCQTIGLDRLGRIEPVHVGAYIETLMQSRTPATVKQHLAALRMLFDWLVAGQVLRINPAAAVKGRSMWSGQEKHRCWRRRRRRRCWKKSMWAR